MRIGTAEHESTFTSQGRALAQVFAEAGYEGAVEIVEARFASTENARKLHDGVIDFGFMAANWVGLARRGETPFSEPIDLRIVAPMNRGPMFFISRAGSGITKIADLRGKRVSVGPEHSGTRQHAHSILGPLGIGFGDFEPRFMDFAAGAEALARGEIDAQLQCPYPNKVMSALDSSTDLQVIGLDDDEIAKVIAASPVYSRTVMRKGSLRALRADSVQPGVLNVLVTHACAAPELVRFAARAIAERASTLEKLNPLFTGLEDLLAPLRRENGVSNFAFESVGLHEGAVMGYRDAGLLTS